MLCSFLFCCITFRGDHSRQPKGQTFLFNYFDSGRHCSYGPWAPWHTGHPQVLICQVNAEVLAWVVFLGGSLQTCFWCFLLVVLII